ncbi:MAG: hypothetical protein V9G12_08625 [Microthrixaceae bacterium]|jgi:hypothetical protein
MKPTPQSPLVSLLALASLGVMGVAYFAPQWWVSLTAPNYPAELFPDGIRIAFGFDGVSNGCTTAPKASRAAQETTQEDLGWRSEEEGAHEAPKSAESMGALDCVHEMNTINHYVGMRPMGVGAPVEILLGRYILAMFGVMLLGFALGHRPARIPVLGAGFAGVAGWMLFDLFGRGWLDAAVTRYKDDASKYFNEAERIAAWGEQLRSAALIAAVALVILMAFVVFASWRLRRFQLLLGLVPAFLPVYFVGAFAAWLWFFGHHMHPWGAFTLKPFMPTVFGDGKVAQFTTHSYPDWGFGLLVAMLLLLIPAVAMRRLELASAGDHASEKPPPPEGPPEQPQGAQ